MSQDVKKPRVLFVGTLPPPVHGSAVVSQQIKDSKAINEAFTCDWVNLGTSRRMEEIGKRNPVKIFRLLGALSREFWLLLTRRYSLCYLAITCHGSGFLKDAPFVLMCKLFRRKIVIHQHNKGMAADVDRWPYSWLLPLCYHNAKVILLSWHLYPDIERVVPRENVFVCPNGIKVPERKNVVAKPDNAVPRLLFLSNLIESKGVLVLLDALKILKDRGYSFVCDFVGAETKEIDAARFNEEVSRRGLNELAFYRGRKYGDDKEKELEQADVFVFPTFYENETFGLVNLEAMAHGKPVVSTDEGGIPDVVKDGENGLIAERKNAESLAQCISKLLEDKDIRRRMGEDGYQKLKAQFSQERFDDRMLLIISSLIAMGGGKITMCKYLGALFGEEKEKMLDSADIFVFPTCNDCFPLVLLEAMLYGLPCVTTDEGGIPDVVTDGQTGLICHTGLSADGKKSVKPETLAGALEKLLSDAEMRARMGEAGREKMLDNFTESSFEQRLCGLLRQLSADMHACA